jgi:hypothetical protein
VVNTQKDPSAEGIKHRGWQVGRECSVESNPENTELAVGVKQELWVRAWIEMK